MGEWKEYKLGDVLKEKGYIRGPFGSALRRGEMKEFGIPVYEQKNAIENSRDFRFFVDNKKFQQLHRFQVKTNDLIISCSGTVGRISIIQEHDPKGIISQALLILRPDVHKITLKYLYYFLSSRRGFDLITQASHGSVQINIAERRVVESIPMFLPPLPGQESIASVLSSLDDKIDLLHRQNKTLEALADTLFRQWFVKGTKNSKNEKLGDFVESANTGLDAIKRAPIVEYETGVKCLRIQDISQNKAIDRWGNSEVEGSNFKRFQLKRDDIIMARTCSPGINLFIREDLPSVFNNGLVRIRARKDKVYPMLLNCLFKTKEFIGHIDGISGGTSVQLNMQVGDLLSYDFSFPPIEIQNEIIGSFISFDEKIFYNQKQIRTLTRLRDTLLPKLMSGEVRVEDAKKTA